MVEQASAVDAVFHALSHATRRAMVARLADQPLTVGELAAPLQFSLAAASKHIKVLEQAGVISRRVEGRRHVCRLEPAALAPAAGWLAHYERFWTDRLDALEDLMQESPKEEQ